MGILSIDLWRTLCDVEAHVPTNDPTEQEAGQLVGGLLEAMCKVSDHKASGKFLSGEAAKCLQMFAVKYPFAVGLVNEFFMLANITTTPRGLESGTHLSRPRSGC